MPYQGISQINTLHFPFSKSYFGKYDKHKPYVHICALTDTYTTTSEYLVILINIIALEHLFIYIIC